MEKDMADLPSLFVSHGAPNLVVSDTAARAFLQDLGRELPRPEAILVVSAHWESERPKVGTAAEPETIHDFRGFDEARLRYPAPGAPDLARRAATLLGEAGVGASEDPARGLDHGAWVPLMLLYPAADVPVTQVSVQPALGPEHHLRIGQALRSLRDDRILVMGSGALTHNLAEARGYGMHDPAPHWVVEFGRWMHAAVEAGRTEDLLDYRTRARYGARNHPTEEHLLPLFAAMGAGGPGRRLHTSETYGVLMMDVYAFA
jgi:4,5-DOPA dioxygenase extradiol